MNPAFLTCQNLCPGALGGKFANPARRLAHRQDSNMWPPLSDGKAYS